MREKYHALALFSGGLDSILAAGLIQQQGLKVLGLHFVSPFFGHPEKAAAWEKTYQVPVRTVDIGREFVDMLLRGPDNGFGRVLNPCVDCKILLLRAARDMLPAFEASFLISGEVIGQRPMSQRRDALNIISRDSGTRDILLRPLSAGLLPPTKPEREGLVDRAALPSIWGRGRKNQLALAKKMNIHPIPTPAGGCLLTESQAAAKFWPILAWKKNPVPDDFSLANTGRQFWKHKRWLTIGRNKEDNDRLADLVLPEDYVLEPADFPGPLAVGRPMHTEDWSEKDLLEAAAITAGYSSKARNSRRAVVVDIIRGNERMKTTCTISAKAMGNWPAPEWGDDILAARNAWLQAKEKNHEHARRHHQV